MADLNHYVSGERVPGRSDRFADVFDPATGAVEKRVPLATTEEVGEVVAIAKAAWPAWAKTPPLRPSRRATGSCLSSGVDPLDTPTGACQRRARVSEPARDERKKA